MAKYNEYKKIYKDKVLEQEFETNASTHPDNRSVIVIQQENNIRKGFQTIALSFDDLEKLYKKALIEHYGKELV